jgi:hypothetical protein
MNLEQWCRKHSITPQALADLKNIFGIDSTPILTNTITMNNESDVQSLVRLEAAKKGIHLFRNNVGVLMDKRGIPVRFGLANDSHIVNEKLKSHDLIGWKPFLIQSHHVGLTIAQFCSRECKEPNWIYKGTPREIAQLAWAFLVMENGGDASFCKGLGTL